MTLVTTSRRSTIESRDLARDLAFALGARYLARGKHGIRELIGTDSSIFIISQEKNETILRWYNNGQPEFERRILKIECRVREGLLTKGIVTSDIDLFSRLHQIYPVISKPQEEPVLIMDGPQRRQTILKIGTKI
ncbi:MAG: hypothetical protein LUQ50_01565 [Methanospirillum sp.]|uniref:hypothetical protein n=1 Tax=Methanospirillum sp. TaxID=45200 RepID=UPI0023760CEA|nr:hypothetical protein [Methanospirillum sp.]MDD1727740.1 hypothetical protein [Methanospirillum sp.]